MTSLDDRTIVLVQAAQKGDDQARNALYQKHWQRVLTVVRFRMGGLLRSRMDSQDIVQSVMIESLGSLDRFKHESEGAFVHWLSKMVENKLRDKADYLKAQKRNVNLEDPGALEEDLPDKRQATPSAIMRRTEQLEALEKALTQLAPKERELIIMNKLEGLSFVEIAQATNQTADAARKATVRALAKLTTIVPPEMM